MSHFDPCKTIHSPSNLHEKYKNVLSISFRVHSSNQTLCVLPCTVDYPSLGFSNRSQTVSTASPQKLKKHILLFNAAQE